jgi:hypothetical protein
MQVFGGGWTAIWTSSCGIGSWWSLSGGTPKYDNVYSIEIIKSVCECCIEDIMRLAGWKVVNRTCGFLVPIHGLNRNAERWCVEFIRGYEERSYVKLISLEQIVQILLIGDIEADSSSIPLRHMAHPEDVSGVYSPSMGRTSPSLAVYLCKSISLVPAGSAPSTILSGK